MEDLYQERKAWAEEMNYTVDDIQEDENGSFVFTRDEDGKITRIHLPEELQGYEEERMTLGDIQAMTQHND